MLPNNVTNFLHFLMFPLLQSVNSWKSARQQMTLHLSEDVLVFRSGIAVMPSSGEDLLRIFAEAL